MKRLEGLVAIVTGGAQGIGAAIALAFAREGAAVAVADIQPATELAAQIEAEGGRIVSVRTDVTSEADMVALFLKVEELLGPVDILVNNAAVGTPVTLIKEMVVEEWERTQRINVTGSMLGIREAFKHMFPRGRGNIVNIASNVAKRGLPHRSAYVSSKWALLGLTQTAALEAVDYGVRVNAICPGPVPTPHLDQVMNLHAEAEGITIEQMAEAWRVSAPMKRFIELDEVAAVAVFLASDESSAMTGQALNVTGGLVMH
jgi:NAD(P)-dependent dehydrogenase (short-subunit alcohol dehydrogenase family)